MSTIRAKADGRLFFDFRYGGRRCREYTRLRDTLANRRRMQAVLDKIDAEILLGKFDYAKAFPNSRLAGLFKTPTATPASGTPTREGYRTVTPSYAEFAEAWFTENEPLWRRSHRATIRSTLDRHLIPAFGRLAVANITKAASLAFRAQRAKLPGRAGATSLSAKTVNRIMQLHCQIMAEAAERYCFADPTVRIKRLKQQRVDIHPFSLVEAWKLIETIRADYRNYLTVRFFTGMRTGEINGLQWKYLDFDRRQILIRETIVRGEIEYTKTDGSQREIDMSQPVFDALLAQQAVTGRRSKFVFCNAQGEPIDLDNFTNRVWYPLLRLLDLEKRRPYQTRHTAATLWLGAGENPEWVARQLGHTNTEMLFKTYSRYVPNLTRSDGAAMEHLLIRTRTSLDRSAFTGSPASNGSAAESSRETRHA